MELVIAKRNEHALFARGAYEVGASHYPFIIVLHVGFFMSLFIEVMYYKQFAITHLFLFILFFMIQLLRIWCVASLGEFWNTKIIVLKGAKVVVKGPYRYVRHPYYVVGCLEILLLPAMFGADFTAVLFTLLNLWMLLVRIPIEEEALNYATNYADVMYKN